MPEEAKVTHELSPQKKPEFDGGSFTIEYLSSSPNGFEVITDKSGRRRDNVTPLTRTPLPLNPEQREQLRIAMADQMKFAHGDKAKLALDRLREAQEKGETTKQLYEDYEKKRTIYSERSVGIIGLRNIRQQDNTLIVDIKPGDFITYKEFSRPESSTELLEMAVISGTSMVLVTKDERLIVQLRSPRNKLHADVPAASAAGYLDGKFYRSSKAGSATQERGTFRSIDTDFVKQNIIKEANEELGLDKEDFSNLTIVGLIREKVQIHDGFLLLATSTLSAEELREKSRNANMNIKPSDEEFYEKFVDIPATPDAILTLLTEVKCPVPPDHIALFVIVGYSMILKEQGLEQANKWKDQMEISVRKNYLEINQLVERYYQDHPNELNNVPQGKPPRNPHGYEPAYLPQEQGLPDVVSELQRVGLIS